MANETGTPTNPATQAVILQIPAPGQTVVVNMQPNQVIEVPFDLTEANVTLAGDDLRIEFPGNAVLILNDFAAMVDQGVSPLMMFADGSVVAGDVLLTALTAEVPETAAGPAGTSGGAGEYEDDMGNLIGTVDRLGPQNPDPFAASVELQVLDEQVINDVPTISVGNATIDEEDVLPGGNPGDSYADGGDMGGWTATGILAVDFGTDGAGSLVISSANDPGATWDGTTLTASDGSWTLTNNGDGTYTFALLSPLAHPGINTEDDIVLNFTATVTDANGDSQALDFTVTVDDDAPVAGVDAAAALDTLTLDESPLAEDGIWSTSANFADNFGATVEYGADGPGTVSYALSLAGAELGSGLFTLGAGGAPGAEIMLSMSGGSIVGTAGGTTYFTISIDAATGVVTFTRFANIWHDDATNHDDPEALTAAAGTILLTQTVTDADNDSISAVLDLSTGVFGIEDDGPTAGVNIQAALDVLTLDESPLAEDGIWSTSANFADNFSAIADFGTDGPGSVAFTLSLTGAELGSGLFALGAGGAQGAEIMLSMSGGSIVGTAGGTTYFTISVDAATGVVTFTRFANIWHDDATNHDDPETLTAAAGTILLTQTVIDADNDSASAALDLSTGVFIIEDDGPSIEGDAAIPDVLTLDESPLAEDGIWSTSANFADNFAALADFGTDGPGSISGYALSLNGADLGSGLFALGVGGAPGAEIMLSMSGGSIVGTAGGTTYFTISVDDNGVVTFTRFANIWHDDATNHDDPEALMAATGTILLTQTVIDADNDSVSAALDLSTNVFFIEDDGPGAIADTNTVDEEGSIGGNVLTNDDFGTDGGGGVVGVAFGSNPAIPVSGGLNTQIDGDHGYLILQANGDYTYYSTAGEITGAEQDVFVYTIQDADGDLSTTTLTINLNGSALTAANDDLVLVNEAALDLTQDGDDLAAGTVTGSLPGSTAETDSDETLADNITGGFGTNTFALLDGVTPTNAPVEGIYGWIQVNSDGTYTYTLTEPFTTSPAANDGTNTIDNAESFTYQVTTGNGNTETATIYINIVDDVPTAYADSNSANEGEQNVTGNVLTDGTDDVFGADEADAAGGVVGVAAGNTGSALDDPSTLGAAIETTYGFLTLNADGSYDYDAKANVAIPEGAQDVFTYTIKDGDGDLSYTTLTIDLTDSALAAANDDLVLVNEAALDLTQDGDDLAAGTVTGSLPGSTAETDSDETLADNVTGGSGTKTFALLTAPNTTTNAAFEGTYGWIQINSDGTYTYTLTKPFTTSPAANDGANTIDNAESFTYQVTNGNGNTTTATIYINIVDDIPNAAIALNAATLGVDETAGINDPDDSAPAGALGQATILGTALFSDTSIFGADGPAGSDDTVYSLQILDADSTGLTDTLSNQAVNLFDIGGGVIEGRTVTDDDLVFTIEIDETNGDTTLTQYRAVKHNDPADPDESGASAAMLADGSLAIRVTITDGDGDIDFAQVALNDVFSFEDDGPLCLEPDSTHIEDLATNPAVVEQLNFLAGTDGINTVLFTMDLDPNDPPPAMDANGNQLTFEGDDLYLYYGSGGTDMTLLEAKTLDGVVGFTIDIDPLTNTYAVHSNGVISNGTATTATDLSGVGGGNVTWKALIDVGGTTEDVMMSTSAGETVNTNNTEIGISDGNSFTAGEAIRFDLINGLNASKVGNDWQFTYDGTHNLAKVWRQEVSFVQGGAGNTANLTVTAILADGDDTFFGDPAGESVIDLDDSGIKVYDDNGALIADLAGAGITVIDNGNSVTINGLREGYTYEVNSDIAFTAIQVEAAANTDEFKLGFFSYGEDSFGSPIDLSYPIVGYDGDGDSITSSIEVTFYPDGVTWSGTTGNDTHSGDADDNVILGDGGNDTLSGLDGDDVIDGNSGNDTLSGGAGNDKLYGGSGGDILDGGSGNDLLDAGSGDDFLVGGDGDDLLIGGLGNDTYSGGAGADTFAFSAKCDEGQDTITDFSVAEGDVLRIYDVLDGNPSNVDVDVAVTGGDVLLTINSSTQITVEGLGGQLSWADGSAHDLGDLMALNIVDLSNTPPTI